MLAELDEFAVFFEGLAVAGSLYLFRAFERRFCAAVLLNQLPRANLADAGLAALAGGGLLIRIAGARNIVNRIAHESHDVGNFFRRDAHDFFDFFLVNDEVGLGWIEHADLGGDELHEVLVARDDENLEILLGGLAGERADNVVCFVAGIFEDGQAHGLAKAADVGELYREIFGHGRALSLIGGEELVAKGGSSHVEGHAEIIRLPVFYEFANHVCEEVRDVGRDAGLTAEAQGHRGIEGAEDIAHGINEEEALWWFGGHVPRLPGPKGWAGEYSRPGLREAKRAKGGRRETREKVHG